MTKCVLSKAYHEHLFTVSDHRKYDSISTMNVSFLLDLMPVIQDTLFLCVGCTIQNHHILFCCFDRTMGVGPTQGFTDKR